MAAGDPTLHLILAESALERVPQALWSHPSVSRSAKKRSKRPGELLLEDTFHHSAMREAEKAGRFTDAERRGRPDIVHTCLLVAMDARLNKDGALRVWVHTRNDEVIEIRPDTRLQRAQHRFFGLMEDLFDAGQVPRGSDEPLLRVREKVPLVDLIEGLAPHHVLLFDEQGDALPIEDVAIEGTGQGDRVVAVIGGFQSGRLVADLSSLTMPVQKVSLGSELLTAWTVVSELVVRYRIALQRRLRP